MSKIIAATYINEGKAGHLNKQNWETDHMSIFECWKTVLLLKLYSYPPLPTVKNK